MNWKAVIIGSISYVVLGLLLGNNFKTDEIIHLIPYILIFLGSAFIAGLLSTYISKDKSLKIGFYTGLIGGILLGIFITLIIFSPDLSRILFEEKELLRAKADIVFFFIMTTMLFTIFGIIGSLIGSFVMGRVYKKFK